MVTIPRKARERLYIAMSKRLTRTTDLCALGINLLIVLSTWGDWRRFAIAVGLNAVIMPLNILFHRLALRHGPRLEFLRTVMNQVVCGVAFQWIGWPLAVWLWLPFIPLAFDALGGRYLINVILQCAIQDALGILVGGITPEIPIAFTVLAIMSWLLVDARVEIIRGMLVTADQRTHELERAHHELQAEIKARECAELELRQAQRLEAIGRLAAGIAHEINTPLQFISNNLQFLREGMNELLGATTDRAREDLDLQYLGANLPSAVAEAIHGVDRVTTIVRSMGQLIHPHAHGVAAVDLNGAVETALTIASHEYKLVADVELRLGNIPQVPCNAGEINQVLLNLIVNAAHAIEDVVGTSRRRGRIEVTTTCEGDAVVITIRDTGCGIPVAIREHIFEPFFTTKEVGRGTGQGLAISYSIVERHGGKLTFESKLGVGTTFELRLPIAHAVVAAA